METILHWKLFCLIIIPVLLTQFSVFSTTELRIKPIYHQEESLSLLNNNNSCVLWRLVTSHYIDIMTAKATSHRFSSYLMKSKLCEIFMKIFLHYWISNDLIQTQYNKSQDIRWLDGLWPPETRFFLARLSFLQSSEFNYNFSHSLVVLSP